MKVKGAYLKSMSSKITIQGFLILAMIGKDIDTLEFYSM